MSVLHPVELAPKVEENPDYGDSFIKREMKDRAKLFAKTASNYASNLLMKCSESAKSAISKVKSAAHPHAHASKDKDDQTEDSDEEHSEAGSTTSQTTRLAVRPRKTKKGPFDFQPLRIVQELNHEHTGAVWCVKFSVCGRLLATAGADCVLRVWCLTAHIPHFQKMRERYSQKMDFESEADFQKVAFESPPPASSNQDRDDDPPPLFMPMPFASYTGHTADIVDLCWSKNYFILSCGMDRTAKLWHISRNECLCCFQHQDFVISVSFLPKDERYFVSGSLDGRIRIWSIPEKKVACWKEVEEKLITALTFVKNGKYIVVGTYYGKCYFYTSELKYHTVITRGKQPMGHKVTGLCVHGDKLLVTYNDSHIHMYDIRDKVLIGKFVGAQHESSQIRASFSPDGRHVACGSEDNFMYLWRTSDIYLARRDRNSMWERVSAHKATVTVALFAPDPKLFLSKSEKEDNLNTDVIVSADVNGSIKIMLNHATNKAVFRQSSPVVAAIQDKIFSRSSSIPSMNF